MSEKERTKKHIEKLCIRLEASLQRVVVDVRLHCLLLLLHLLSVLFILVSVLLIAN